MLLEYLCTLSLLQRDEVTSRYKEGVVSLQEVGDWSPLSGVQTKSLWIQAELVSLRRSHCTLHSVSIPSPFLPAPSRLAMEGFGGGEMERGSVAGIELLTRTSLNSLRDANQVSSSYLWESLSHTQDDRNWSWAYLRQQFKLKDMEVLYKQYQHQLQKGYFSVFLVAQFLLTAMHVIALLVSSQMSTVLECLPDMVLYCSTVILCVPLVAVVHKERHATKAAVFVTALLTLADLAPILYQTTFADDPSKGDNEVERMLHKVVLRPAYPVHTLLAVYCFLPFSKNRHAIPAALGVTIVHLMVLATVTYKESTARIRAIMAEVVFYSCINFLGLYFRFVNEVIIRRTFLDRRACVESTLRLNYEKEQEEQLMLSILPKHIAARVKADIRSIFQQIKSHQEAPLKRKPFRELYVEEHDNVTILYADVVNFSKLTVSLHPKKLVETLNELFTRFDDASEDHGVLRIKFLGDSYYCVSGVPKPNPRHAEACVDLALDMISIIKEVRQERELDVDMRIGIHTGKILSGVLGVCKWQYDVWSKDVIIANHMEQTGKPGKVHVSQQTRDSLGHCYSWEPSDGASRDQLLEKNNINTYFVTSKNQCECDPSRNIEMQKKEIRSSKEFKRSRRPYDPARHTMFMENNLILYQQMLRRADESMANAIKQMPVGNYSSWTSIKDVNPLCLTFEHLSWELPFLQQPDPLFKFYVAGALFVLICIRSIQALDLIDTSRDEWLSFILAGATLLMALPLTWTHFIWNRIKDPHQEMDVIPEPGFPVLRLLYRASLAVVWSNSTRTFLYLIVTFLLASSSFLHVAECSGSDLVTVYTIGGDNETNSDPTDSLQDCITPWHITETSSLALLMCFLFLRVHFQLKLLVSSLMVTAHIIMVFKINPQIFQNGATWNAVLSPQVSHILSVIFLMITIHLLDRQAEYMIRLDYRWKRQLSEEQEEASTTRTVNKMLLQNILPIHVADVYLNTSRPHEELYHEQYDSVAVMFASLIDTTISNSLDNDRNFLEVINYVICGFDKLLLEASGQKIEKIKVAGRTYMAACGLEPGRRDSNCLSVQSDNHAVILTRFAIHMMKLLDKYNRSNNFKFQLTVGIAHGAVAAGVVGSQKPLYDIWGDAVNLASRMDSTGVPARIQVPEDTAKLLEKNGVPCEERGETFVKGKGYLKTFFVSELYKLQVSTPIMQGEHASLQVTKL